MTAAELIAKIEHLSHEEQIEVFEYMRAAKAAGKIGEPSSGTVDEEFKQVADEVFTTNEKLFCKLAE